jgi:hypothetical protein
MKCFENATTCQQRLEFFEKEKKTKNDLHKKKTTNTVLSTTQKQR